MRRVRRTRRQAVLGLSTLTIAAAALAATPAAAGPTHKKPPPQPSPSSSEPETPAAPTAPPDPTVPPEDQDVGSIKAISEMFRQDAIIQARKTLNDDAFAMSIFCAKAFYPGLLAEAGQSSFPGATWRQLCQAAIQIVLEDVAELRSLNIPPAAIEFVRVDTSEDFMQVALTSPGVAASVALSCAKRVTPRQCRQVRAALLGYSNALATTLAASTGLSTALERFDAAQTAGSVPGALLQAGAAKAYAGELVAALTAELSAAKALAAALGTKADLRLTARGRAAAARKLAAPNGLPASIVSAVLATGAAKDATELRQALAAALSKLPATLSLTKILSTPKPTAWLTGIQRSITTYEVAALVRGLDAQGALGEGAGDTLLDDLRAAINATTPDAHAAALAKLRQDITAQVTGPAGALLTSAVQPLP
jgi:hypothetical protein